ncbi:DNA-binding transcriptional regulator, CsgD family [Tistlia consotensis]|uniref:DNA-binding transcriptional regulator, CsgD family n=1 Tax=Tistlia consotensis USBA 355 TaxID=560819 RepID=A0A1Y6CEW7_9PROT|nr:LuxR family transcriptional regulator [Tistlia consotensis]SMF51587.1 DNA-binding transcriptional regulator, CsgD family [Tistlia consotensis USBA 355]SNR83966.1 DNA-binding transcriptional regulator, CsgD family [Tistlia consotensis]
MSLAAWNQGLAGAVSAIGSPQFPAELVAALKRLAVFDYSVMFAYCGDVRPIDLYDNFPAGKRRVFVDLYQEGPYLLDPFYLACARKVAPALYRLRDLAPDRFYQSEYFRSYYVQTGLSEEIGFFLALPGEVRAVVSLMRADATPAFSAREFATLQEAWPVVAAAAGQHWRDLHRHFSVEDPGDGPSTIQRTIDYAFRTFGRSVLTARERDVVEYVLKGHSSEAIGKILGISPGTVRIHRKNIYAKLGINSQGELFSQFIRALSSGAGGG